jgi:hypothetical protein
MTTTVNVTAHCSTEKEVQISVSGKLDRTIQNGESAEICAYDDREIQIKEVLKAAPADAEIASETAAE